MVLRNSILRFTILRYFMGRFTILRFYVAHNLILRFYDFTILPFYGILRFYDFAIAILRFYFYGFTFTVLRNKKTTPIYAGVVFK